MTAGTPLLSVEELVVQFRTHEGTIHAVNGVTFQLEEGERLGLVGESGCGKSVTNLAMMRLLPQPAGRIVGGHVMFDAQDLTKLREDELRSIRGRDIAMIFQDPMTSLNPVLTVEEQMIETIMAHREISRDKARPRDIRLRTRAGRPQPEGRHKTHPPNAPGAAPIMVVASTNDPATPYAGGVSLSKQLSSGVLVTHKGEGHTVYAQGDTCVDTTVDHYLINGVVPTSDPICN